MWHIHAYKSPNFSNQGTAIAHLEAPRPAAIQLPGVQERHTALRVFGDWKWTALTTQFWDTKWRIHLAPIFELGQRNMTKTKNYSPKDFLHMRTGVELDGWFTFKLISQIAGVRPWQLQGISSVQLSNVKNKGGWNSRSFDKSCQQKTLAKHKIFWLLAPPHVCHAQTIDIASRKRTSNVIVFDHIKIYPYWSYFWLKERSRI